MIPTNRLTLSKFFYFRFQIAHGRIWFRIIWKNLGTLLCLMLGGKAGRGGQIANFWEKNKVSLIIIRECPKKQPPSYFKISWFSNLGQSDLYGTGIKARFQLFMAGPMTRCIHCKLYITVRQRIVRYSFVDSRALFLWTKYLRETLDFI